MVEEDGEEGAEGGADADNPNTDGCEESVLMLEAGDEGNEARVPAERVNDEVTEGWAGEMTGATPAACKYAC